MTVDCPTCHTIVEVEDSQTTELDCKGCGTHLVAGIDEDAVEYGAEPVFVQIATQQ